MEGLLSPKAAPGMLFLIAALFHGPSSFLAAEEAPRAASTPIATASKIPPPKPATVIAPPTLSVTAHLAAVQKGKSLVGWSGKSIAVNGKVFRADCSGFVMACYHAAGAKLLAKAPAKAGEDSLCRGLWEQYKDKASTDKSRVPKAGDLVFFDNTWDRNGNGLRDDRFTHVAMVESASADGSFTCLHLSSGSVKRLRVDLRHPESAQRNGKTANDWLRRTGKNEKPTTRNLAGALFSAMVSP